VRINVTCTSSAQCPELVLPVHRVVLSTVPGLRMCFLCLGLQGAEGECVEMDVDLHSVPPCGVGKGLQPFRNHL